MVEEWYGGNTDTWFFLGDQDRLGCSRAKRVALRPSRGATTERTAGRRMSAIKRERASDAK